MVSLKSKITLLLLCATIAAVASQASQGGPHVSQGGGHASQGGSHQPQGGPHENQSRARRQAKQMVECDVTTMPKFSCHDCNTGLICTPNGGFLKPCGNPRKPYCNNGFCSFVPAEGCAA